MNSGSFESLTGPDRPVTISQTNNTLRDMELRSTPPLSIINQFSRETRGLPNF
jgi:hypothetical protein